TRFSPALQCLLERCRKGLIGCDQLLAFGGRVGGGDSWARLAVVVTLQGTHAHIVCELCRSQVAVVVRILLVVAFPQSADITRAVSRCLRSPKPRLEPLQKIEVVTVRVLETNHAGTPGLVLGWSAKTNASRL